MIIGSIEAQPHQLSYDKIIKNTLASSNEITIRFINGLFSDDIPLDAPVEWLDKESVTDKHTAIVADFYPKIDGKMYSIEVESDDKGDMAIRVFKYTVGGAIHHGMTATDAELSITFPQPCVVFLKSKADTPQKLTWNIDFFDGQRVTLHVPVIQLAELSVEEIARRNLLPIGQFYMRTFEPLTDRKIEAFQAAGTSLLAELQAAVERGFVPFHIGVQMQDTIHKIADNVMIRSKKEVGFTMTTNIVETLPWVDYSEVFAKLEERGRAEGRTEGLAEGKAEGRAEGIAEGKAERDMEIAVNAFGQLGRNRSIPAIHRTLKDFGISADIIEAAQKQAEAQRTLHPRQYSGPER